jgi:PAS domain S-box-containing protein
MARKQIGRYPAARNVRLSIPKRPESPFHTQAPSIHPWRDGILAGFAVAAAISLGAYVVYARAWNEKVADVRHHVAELAARLGRSASGPHEAMQKLPKEKRTEATATFSAPLAYARDNNDAVRRIYTFSLEDDEKLTLLDTGSRGQPAAARPLPPAAREFARRQQELREPWTLGEGLEATAFAILPARDGRPSPGVIAVETDAERLEVKFSSVRQALGFTCMLGAGVGIFAGFLVWRMRARAATAFAQLAESHRMEEAIIASLGEAIYTFDATTGLYRWRGNARALLGFQPAAAGEERGAWLARLHSEDAGRYIAAQEAAIAHEQPMVLEYRVQRPDGSIVWVLDRGQPLPLSGGHVLLVGSLIDLTSRREAEETLRLFFDETATAHVVFEGDTVLDANPAAVELFAAGAREDLLALPIWKLWPRRQPTHDHSAAAWSSHVHEAMSGSGSHFEWTFVRMDGALLDCDVFLRQASLRGRAVLLLACYDISPAKIAQKQLIESERRFRDVSEAAGEFIWEVNAGGHYVYASARVTEVLGLAPAELIGRSPFEFVPEEDRERVVADSEKIHAAGLSFRNFEHRVLRTDGTIKWISVSGVPIYDSDGRVTGYRGASLDITQHREYERELLLQKEAAEAADRAKSSFLAMMSHEIRTPLNSVLGFADIVLDTPLTERQRDYLRTIKGSGDALLTLLNDILDFSKIESGRMEIEIRPTDIPRAIQEVLELHHLAAATKNLTLAAKTDTDVPQYVLTDPARLRQILINLVGNAVKFTPTGGSIHIHATLHRDEGGGEPRIRILVEDTGIGITSGQRERLFKPFTQADSSTTRRFGGTGLGLAISRRLAALLDGDLGLLEREGPGSTFHVDLPVRTPSAQEIENLFHEPETEIFSRDEPEAADGAEAAGGRAPRVLVVDDNTLNRRLTAHLLHQAGAETTVAASAQECFEQLAAQKFDIVLMDVQMPVMDGLDATRHIRAQETAKGARPVPIVALTADAMVGDRERCLEAGMDDYLTKPLRRDELQRMLGIFAHRRAD